MKSSKSPRVLITRLSHIGDCLLTLPMVNAIRRQYPDAYIAWAVESPSHQLLELCNAIDHLIMVPKGWLKKPGGWSQLFRELRRPNFDIAIDPQGITKSAALGRISGAKTRIGIRGRWGRELSPYLNNRLIKTTQSHLVDRSLEMLSAIEVRDPHVDFQLPICLESDQKIQRFLKEKQDQADLSDRWVAINPGASWDSKRWVVDRFADVARYLYQQHGFKSVVTWAGAAEQEMASRIHHLEPMATVLAEPTSLRELAALYRYSEFFVGCDTGPLHLATAMGTPCIGLYGTTRPEESGAYGSQHVAVQKWYQSGSCRQRRQAENQAMQDIQVSDVNQAVDTMIAKIAANPLQRRFAG